MKVNIYLTRDQSTQLTAISYKYQVSKSTIAEKVLFYLTKYLLKEKKKEKIELIGNEYIYEEKGNKTCIKPKLDPVNNKLYKNSTKPYTNCLVIYLKKDIKKYVENTKELNNEINTALQTTKEENWDYNRFIRSMARYERKTRQKFCWKTKQAIQK